MRTLNTERGETLVGILVAVLIFGFIVAMMARVTGFNVELVKQVQLDADREELRRYIGSTTSCPGTRAGAGGSCPPSGARKAAYRETSSGTPTTYINGSGAFSKIGEYEIQMICFGDMPMILQFQVRHVTPNTTGPWDVLYKKVPFQC